MSEVLLHRATALAGLVLAACAAAWWLGSSRLLLDNGGNPARVAVNVLHALLLVRGVVASVLCVRVGALRGWRAGMATGLGLIAPSWPVVLLAWSASTAPLWGVVLGEISLIATAMVLPVLGAGLRRAIGRTEPAVIAATAAGVALASAGLAFGARVGALY